MIPDAAPWVTASTWTGGQLVALVIALMVMGLLLLAAEVFVIPGFGIAGVLGIASLGGGVVLAWGSWGAMTGVTLLFGSLAGTVLFALLFFKSRAGNRLMLDETLASTTAVSDDDKRLIGRQGVAVTMLRPSGAAEFGEERVEVETDGDFIAQGQPVVVVAVEMGRVVVELAPDGEDASEGAEDRTENTDE
jgi:membrane-bound serine protease (ClpP class)